MEVRLDEELLIRAWHRLRERDDLVTEAGEPFRIIFPGRRNGDRGPDLHDAVLDTRRGPVKGDIEVHVRASDWYAHGHHLDAVYNRVVLHLVMWHNGGMAARLQNGDSIAEVALHRYFDSLPGLAGPGKKEPLPCQNRRSLRVMTRVLDEAGDARFREKAARFSAGLAREDGGQVLYAGVMAALGYTRNQAPFKELARRVPLRELEQVLRRESAAPEGLVQLQALLLGAAGLLPSQRLNGFACDSYAAALEERWQYLKRGEAMPAADWHLYKVRPNNSPLRRLAALGHLLLRYRQGGILAELIERGRAGDTRGAEAGLVVVAGADYWTVHSDFGTENRIRAAALLGPGRARDIIVNVLLPFGFALGKVTGDGVLSEQALRSYQSCPGGAPNNIEQHMLQQLGLDGRRLLPARRQQGLLHLFKIFCSEGACARCPLGADYISAGNSLKLAMRGQEASGK